MDPDLPLRRFHEHGSLRICAPLSTDQHPPAPRIALYPSRNREGETPLGSGLEQGLTEQRGSGTGWTPRYGTGAAAPLSLLTLQWHFDPRTPGFTSEKTELGERLARMSKICVWKGWELGHTSREEWAQAQQRVPFPSESTPKHSLFSNITCTCFPPRCSKDNNLH